MARGGMPMRPSGGGRAPQPPRRGAQPRQQPNRQQRTAKGAPKGPATEAQRRAAEQQRRLVEQQRRAAAAKAAQQKKLRQQQFLREAHGLRREEEAERLTLGIRVQEEELAAILATGLRRSSQIDLDSLLQSPDLPSFDPGPLAAAAPKPVLENFLPGRLSGLWGGRADKEDRETAAREEFDLAWEKWESDEAARNERLAAAQRAHDEMLASRREQAGEYNSRIARVAAGLRERDPAAVESYLRTVLRRMPLPEGFPRRADITHHPERERVVVRWVLPGREIVPEFSEYEYLAAPDELRPVPRSAEDAAQLYELVVAQVALLVVRELLEADLRLAGVTCHALVAGPEPACLVNLTANRDTFMRLDLERQSAVECLRRLGAEVSLGAALPG